MQHDHLIQWNTPIRLIGPTTQKATII